MTNKLQITAVPIDMVEMIWDPCETLLQTIADRAPRDVSIEKAYNSIRAGKMLLTVVSDQGKIIALNVLDVRTNETGYRYLMIPLTAGERMDEWLDDFMQLAYSIARARDCAALRGMAARKGWTRALKKYECEEIYTVIEMPVPLLNTDMDNTIIEHKEGEVQ